MNSIPQISTSAQNGTQVQNLLAHHTIEPMPGTFGQFKVYNAHLDRYTVDTRDLTCTCPSYLRDHARFGTCCKHLRGLRGLIAQQIAAYWTEMRRIEAELKRGLTWEQRERLESESRTAENAAWALEAIENNIWGNGTMAVPVEFGDPDQWWAEIERTTRRAA